MKSKKIVFIFILSMLFLLSCASNLSEEIQGSHANIDNSVRPTARSHLYARVPGLSELRLQTLHTDRFNLRFSHTGHFYTENIYVEITASIEDAVIYYTTNGSDPVRGLTSQHNRRYTGPILISAGDSNTPTVLKARAFLSDDIYSNILTHTYFVSADIYSRFSQDLYVFSISSDPFNLFDHDRGILVAGRLREEWHAANPGRHANPPYPANFNIRGREGERPGYVQVINARGELVISQAIGIRVRGGWSRAASRQSLGLYARREYDPVFDRFYHDFFRFFNDLGRGRSTVRGTDTPVESFTQIVLRNGGNDRNGAHVREELSHTLAKQAGFLDYKGGVAPAAMFLNGEYRGFFWLQQMYPAYYFFDHYGEVPKSNIEVLYWFEEPHSVRMDGNDEAFHDFASRVCITNYIQYFAFQIYIANRDWPHNNLKFWRFNGEGGEAVNRYFDGKFRMLPYDMEMAWGMYGQNARERHIGRVRDTTASFRNLMRRDDMVEKFCNQMFDFIHTIFRPENVIEILYRLIDLQDDEIHFAIRRGASSTNRRQLERERESIVRFAESRAEHVIDDMARSFGLENRRYNVTVTGKAGTTVRLNTLSLDGAGVIESSYFTAHSVLLSADRHSFSHWIINGVRYDTPEIMLNSDKGSSIVAEVFLNN